MPLGWHKSLVPAFECGKCCVKCICAILIRVVRWPPCPFAWAWRPEGKAWGLREQQEAQWGRGKSVGMERIGELSGLLATQPGWPGASLWVRAIPSLGTPDSATQRCATLPFSSSSPTTTNYPVFQAQFPQVTVLISLCTSLPLLSHQVLTFLAFPTHTPRFT